MYAVKKKASFTISMNLLYLFQLGIYGNCKTEYVVTTGVNNTKIVRKILDSQSCWHHPAKKWASSQSFLCPSNYLVSYTDKIVSKRKEYYFTLFIFLRLNSSQC